LVRGPSRRTEGPGPDPSVDSDPLDSRALQLKVGPEFRFKEGQFAWIVNVSYTRGERVARAPLEARSDTATRLRDLA